MRLPERFEDLHDSGNRQACGHLAANAPNVDCLGENQAARGAAAGPAAIVDERGRGSVEKGEAQKIQAGSPDAGRVR